MQEIGLQELIDSVRQELLSSNQQNPIFFVEKVELELAVKVVKQGNGGIKVTVFGFVEGNVGGTLGAEHGHTVKISLSSLFDRREILSQTLQDPAKKDMLMKYAQAAFVKDDTAGQV